MASKCYVCQCIHDGKDFQGLCDKHAARRDAFWQSERDLATRGPGLKPADITMGGKPYKIVPLGEFAHRIGWPGLGLLPLGVPPVYLLESLDGVLVRRVPFVPAPTAWAAVFVVAISIAVAAVVVIGGLS